MLGLTLIDEIIRRLSSKGRGAGRGRRKSKDKARFVTVDLSRLVPSTSVEIVLANLGASPRSKVLSSHCVQLSFDEPHAVVIRSLYLTRSVLEVLYDHWGKKATIFPLASQFSAFRRSLKWTENEFDKCAKYFCVRFMAQFLDNDLPPPPPPGYGPMSGNDWMLFEGPVRRYLKNRLVVKATSAKVLHLFQGLLQGVKRGAYQVSPQLVSKVLLGQAQTLGSNKPATWSHEGIYGERFRYYIRLIVSTLYQKHPLGERLGVLEPSTNASADSTRDDGGQRAAVVLHLKRLFGDQVFDDMQQGAPHSFVEVRPGVVETQNWAVVPTFDEIFDRVMERYSLEPLAKILPEDVREFTTFLDPNFREFSKDWEGDYFSDPEKPVLHSRVKISPVLEPLKVRLVSCGEPLKYWLSRPFQKWMWSGLQRTKIFRLTGRPLERDDLTDLLEAGKEDWMFTSGDFSGATDSIRMIWTVYCFEALLEASQVSPKYAALMRRVIYGQELFYAKQKTGLPRDLAVWQCSGQLMGSTLSFPILCILNLASYLLTLEMTEGRRLVPKDVISSRVLINGDDILFRVPPDGTKSAMYQHWLRAIDVVGFELSLGKNYVHPSYLMINSQGYSYNPQTSELAKIGFLNVGLLIGKSKTAARESAKLTPLQGKYSEVVPQAHDRARAHNRFIHYNRKVIDTLTMSGKFSLQLDPLLGGLGFPKVPEVKCYLTAFQKKLAKFAWDQLKGKESDHIGYMDLPKNYVGVICPSEYKERFESPQIKPWGSFVLQARTAPLDIGESVAYEPLSTVRAPLQRERVLDILGDLDVKAQNKIRYPTRRFMRMINDLDTPAHLSAKSLNLYDLSTTHWWVSRKSEGLGVMKRTIYLSPRKPETLLKPVSRVITVPPLDPAIPEKDIGKGGMIGPASAECEESHLEPLLSL